MQIVHREMVLPGVKESAFGLMDNVIQIMVCNCHMLTYFLRRVYQNADGCAYERGGCQKSLKKC